MECTIAMGSRAGARAGAREQKVCRERGIVRLGTQHAGKILHPHTRAQYGAFRPAICKRSCSRMGGCSGVRKDHRTAAHAACQPAAPRKCRRANHAVRTSQRADVLSTSRWRKYEVVPRCVGNTIHWNAGALKIKAWHWLAPTTAQWRPGQTGGTWCQSNTKARDLGVKEACAPALHELDAGAGA